MKEQAKETYAIIRWYYVDYRHLFDNKPAEMIKEGLTLEEAQAHCSSAEARADGFFDSFYKEAK